MNRFPVILMFVAVVVLVISSVTVSLAHHINTSKSVQAEITKVEAIVTQTTQHVPKQVCEWIQVPIYQTVQRQGNAGEGALLGMILGGILGKEITGDQGGRNAGVVIGALVGADKAAGQERIIAGYKKQKKCRTVYNQVNSNNISSYKIYFMYDGMQGTATSSHKYNVGDKINVNLGLSID